MSFQRMVERMSDPSTAAGRNYARYSRAMTLRWRVLRGTMGRIPLIGGVLTTFWDGMLPEQPGGDRGLSGAVWALTFAYLGDYLFYHRPMTVDYAESWMARVPWPRHLHVHVAPCRIVRWRDSEGHACQATKACTRR